MIASQKIVLAAGEAVQLPPYADTLLFEGADDLSTCGSSDGTFRAITGASSGIASIYAVPSSGCLQYIKSTAGGNLYYRVSKR
jgi:hypothetical protein